MEHTPAPWVVRDGDDWPNPIIDSPNVGAGYYASLATATQRDPHPVHGGGIDMATAMANARLIAASPDMLTALQAIIAEVAGPAHPYSRDSYLPAHLVERAQSAIAKATGKD